MVSKPGWCFSFVRKLWDLAEFDFQWEDIRWEESALPRERSSGLRGRWNGRPLRHVKNSMKPNLKGALKRKLDGLSSSCLAGLCTPPPQANHCSEQGYTDQDVIRPTLSWWFFIWSIVLNVREKPPLHLLKQRWLWTCGWVSGWLHSTMDIEDTVDFQGRVQCSPFKVGGPGTSKFHPTFSSFSIPPKKRCWCCWPLTSADSGTGFLEPDIV